MAKQPSKRSDEQKTIAHLATELKEAAWMLEDLAHALRLAKRYTEADTAEKAALRARHEAEAFFEKQP